MKILNLHSQTALSLWVICFSRKQFKQAYSSKMILKTCTCGYTCAQVLVGILVSLLMTEDAPRTGIEQEEPINQCSSGRYWQVPSLTLKIISLFHLEHSNVVHYEVGISILQIVVKKQTNPMFFCSLKCDWTKWEKNKIWWPYICKSSDNVCLLQTIEIAWYSSAFSSLLQKHFIVCSFRIIGADASFQVEKE